MLTILGFAAQLIVIASIISVIISCASLSHSCIVVTSEDHPSGAEPLCNTSDSDASLSSARACTKSIISASYTVVIDEPVRLADGLSALTIRELKALCRERGVKRYSSLRKHELIELLSAL